MSVDTITMQVIRYAMEQIADEMGYILVRTGRSTIIKEIMDISCAVFDHNGHTIAQAHHAPMMLTGLEITMQKLLEQFSQDNLHPGDVIISNDPYMGGQHIMDMQCFSPVFYDDVLIGFVGSIAHQSDMGGTAPGGVAGGMTEIYQEGLRLPFVKLYRAGELNTELEAIIRNNIRVPDKTMGDIHALVASCRVGGERLQQLYAKYGAPVIQDAVAALMDYSEKRIRDGLRQLKDGVYTGVDFIDSDGVTDEPLRVQVNVHKVGDKAVVHFEGTSLQARGNINCPISTTHAAVYYSIICIIDPDVPPNAGCYRPVEIQAAEGTIVNPRLPGAVAARTTTSQKIVEAMSKAFAPVVPDRVMAGSHGQISTSGFSGYHPTTGKRFVYTEIQGGGAGARPNKDGREGQDSHLARFMNTPVEAAEMEFPIRTEYYGFIPDTGGAGKYRGALAMRKDIRFLVNDVSFARYGDRQEFAPFGLFGGLEGAKGRFLLNPGTPGEIRVKSKGLSTLCLNDLVSIRLPAGGGYGNPLERDTALVRQDVRDGKVSVEAARDLYGVIVNPDGCEVDEKATSLLREARRQKQ